MGLGTSSHLGRWIQIPPPFGTDQKARTGGGGALAFTGDRIKRSLRSDDRKAEKKDAARLVSSTTIEYRADHTRFDKSRHTGDNTYRRMSATLEGRVSTPNKKFSRYTPGYQKLWTIFLYPHLCALLWQPLTGDEQAPQRRGSSIPSPDSASVSSSERWAPRDPMFPRCLCPGRGFLRAANETRP